MGTPAYDHNTLLKHLSQVIKILKANDPIALANVHPDERAATAELYAQRNTIALELLHQDINQLSEGYDVDRDADPIPTQSV